MIAAIATIVFLSAAWAAIVAIVGSLDGNLTKVGAALRGQSPGIVAQPLRVRVSPRYPQVRVQQVRARPALRAAA